ncbi:chemotaxis protein CheW [Propionispora sp. 2/2-37]|uniref:chemotaxis protein CheW n=1 Tax=Propionispora sp. 2/2-37 TaxID=1677858 RepID=UPI0006BB6B74|nr:chemotaxis protein CheW [Propionispora sp. 2/2-37]
MMAMEQLVAFRLGREEYAISISQVKEIVRYSGATKLPNTPAHMEGIINLRSNVIPVVNLAKRFDLPVEEVKAKQVVILETAGLEVGVIVDEVTEVLMIEEENMEPAPMMEQQEAFFRGIGKLGDRLMLILDLDVLFDREETEMLQNVG